MPVVLKETGRYTAVAAIDGCEPYLDWTSGCAGLCAVCIEVVVYAAVRPIPPSLVHAATERCRLVQVGCAGR